MKGKLQYRFKGTAEHKEKNYVVDFKNVFSLIISLIKVVKKSPDQISIFPTKS